MSNWQSWSGHYSDIAVRRGRNVLALASYFNTDGELHLPVMTGSIDHEKLTEDLQTPFDIYVTTILDNGMCGVISFKECIATDEGFISYGADGDRYHTKIKWEREYWPDE